MKINNNKTTDTTTSNINALTNFVEAKIREYTVNTNTQPTNRQARRAKERAAKKQATRAAEKQAKRQAKKDDSCLLEQFDALCDEIPLETIGIDLGDKAHRVCIVDRPGNITLEKSIDNNRVALAELACQHPEARFVMKVGTHRVRMEAGFVVLKSK